MDQKRAVRVVETSDVTAENLEQIINDLLQQGYVLDTIRFAMRDHSRRPAMAFLIFYSPAAARQAGLIPAPESCAAK